QEGNIQLSVNGNIRQKNDLNNMIRPVQKIISELSQFYTLFPGDIIFTGTPDGVGKLEKGDRIFAEIDGLEPLTITIN
ncbi:MAG TPA: fumarylacetoacetate hydrolase family protein, partial [Candidatus Marinimicrobia bacterium]|nr:fumarylacetoacetate hydrolase family protein [Candidatus Neomarinimicrobiota bacterium]